MEKKQTKKQQIELDKIKYLAELQALLKPGDTVQTILRHVSSSGMSRDISLIFNSLNISYQAAIVMGDKLSSKSHCDAIRASGCGMDMGYSLVYNLGRCLFPAGFIPADAGRRIGRNGSPATELDTDGGYALKHSWL